MGNLQEDDVMPNDGAYFSQPQEQVKERRKERANTLEGLAILKQLLERFNQRIDYYEKTTNIPDDVRLDPQQFLILHNTHSLTAKTLTAEKEYIEGLIEEHTKR
jgi:hypothetical protein